MLQKVNILSQLNNKFRLVIATFGFAFNFLFSNGLYAVDVPDLFEAEIGIDGFRSANSKQVLGQGIRQVLIKVTGNVNITEHPNIKPAVDNPEYYLQQYSHKIIENSAATSLDDGSEIKVKKLVSIQKYNEERIHELLKKSGIPIWGSQRPLTLAWVTIEFDPKTRLVLNDTDITHFNNLYKDIVKSSAAIRGVPIAFPLQDLEEQLQISPSSIWAQFPDDLRRASLRYGPDIIISASIQPRDESTWQAKWLIIGQENTIEYITSAPNLTRTIEQGVSWLADTLAKFYASEHGASELVKIRVNDINNIKDLTNIEKYIEGLTVVERLRLVEVDKDNLEFEVLVKDGKSSLVSAFNLDSKLVKQKVPVLSKEKSTDSEISKLDEILHFRWRT